MPEISNLPPSAPEHPAILWPHTIPSLISEDPPGRRPLFDAIVAYTACIRFEKILVNFEVQSSGQLAQLIELSLKSYLDIMQDTTNMLTKVEALFDSEDPLRLLLRWRLLQHTIVQILGDANPRIAWVNYLGTKAFSSSSFLVTNDVQRFYIEALRHTLSGAQQIPRQIIDMRQKYDFLAVPGVDLVYFAFIMDITSLQNICYHILSHPRLEYLYLASLMVSGARIRGEPCLDALATDLDTTMRSMSGWLSNLVNKWTGHGRTQEAHRRKCYAGCQSVEHNNQYFWEWMLEADYWQITVGVVHYIIAYSGDCRLFTPWWGYGEVYTTGWYDNSLLCILNDMIRMRLQDESFKVHQQYFEVWRLSHQRSACETPYPWYPYVPDCLRRLRIFRFLLLSLWDQC